MNGVANVTVDTNKHSVDVNYDDLLVTIPQMKNELDYRSYYVAYVNLTAEQANNLLQTESNLVTVDVREESEYCTNHISGAVLSSWTSEVFQNQYLSTLPTQGSILLVCKSGNRSSLAGNFLYYNSFSINNNVIIYNIKNGMDGWNYTSVPCPQNRDSILSPSIYLLLTGAV